MRVVVVNERTTPPMLQKRVRRDFNSILALHPTFVLWLELTKYLRYVRALRRVFGADKGWTHFFTSGKNPISVRQTIHDGTDRWRVIEARSHLLTRGARWIPQPRRKTTVLVLMNLRTLAVVALVNSHFTNGKKNRRFSLRSRRARRALWVEQHADTSLIVHNLINRKISVVGGGDLNDLDPAPFHPDQRWLLKRGVMGLYVIEAPDGSQVSVESTFVVPDSELETDHAALGANLILHRR